MADYQIILADDDDDDCMFFKDALDELSITACVRTVNNGVELMKFLETHPHNLPDVIFLDLNMPRKTGFECLTAIKNNEQLKRLNVIIYSTSSNQDMIDLLYNNGAQFYIRKPAAFADLKLVIHKAILLSRENTCMQPSKDKFVVQPQRINEQYYKK
jgi:CheY-like chemotaxis protein